MGRKYIKYLLTVSSIFLFGLAAVMSKKVGAEEPTYHIYDEEDLVYYANELGGNAQTYQGLTLLLEADIELSGETEITFGSKDAPFAGTFDGQGYTISGLKNEKSALPDHDNGLFSWTDGATIKNLILKDPVVDCAYRGGILVGYAKNTTIENIRIHGGKLKIQPANNVVSLITNVGFSGGAVAGTLDNSTMYNCEVRGTEVVNNSTQGVAALGGEGLYMGGLVGSAANHSVIEYCRMDDGWQINENGIQTMVESIVRNEYDVAIGALGGKAVYAGGIAGEIKGGSQIIDSYSTADVYAYSATYVSVGAGNVSYVGGVVAEVYGSNCKVVRCHYAGNAHSRQYNAVLVIPIPENDKYVSGVAQYSESDEIVHSYFKRSSSTTTKDIRAINDEDDTETCSALTDEQYEDRDFWKGKGYDLTGTIAHTEGVTTDTHYNKWVMDYERGIPIHGNSVSAAFDFPGAGSVTIGGTELIKNSIEGNLDVDCSVKTDTPYSFAVQGFDTYEKTVGIKAETRIVNGEGTDRAADFKFCGWYLVRDNLDDSASRIKEYYESITGENGTGTLVGSETGYTAGADGYPLEDNDLYVAHYQANVVFHDINGDVINKDSGETETEVHLEDDYYNYQDEMYSKEPVTMPAGEGYLFYGWTDVPYTSPEGGKEGYAGISSNVLETLVNGGNIYQSGDLVEKPLDLYPIYTNYMTNVITEMEGYDQDENPEIKSQRDYVGQTSVVYEDGKLYIEVKGLDGSNEVTADGTFQDGYRFLGWYEVITGADGGEETEYLISTDMKHELKDVDLSKVHTYRAKLEYRVDYLVNLKDSDHVLYPDNWIKYTNFWQKYESYFQDIAVAFSYNRKVDHWSTLQAHNSNDDGYCNGSTIVRDRMTVYGHDDQGSLLDYNIIVTGDFPGAAKTLGPNGASAAGDKFGVTTTVNDGYNFIGWGYEKYYEKDYHEPTWSRKQTYVVGVMVVGRQYYFEAHYTADVKFSWIDEESFTGTSSTVQRRYQDNVLMEAEDHTYTSPSGEVFTRYSEDAEQGTETLTREASPSVSPFTKDGVEYYFLGWVDVTDLSETEQAYLFDGGDEYTTSSAQKVQPYLIDESDLVEHPMELKAVYAKSDIVTTTNIKEAGVPDNSGINIPADPAVSGKVFQNNGTLRFTLTVDTDTSVTQDEDSGLYKFLYMECITTKKDGTVTVGHLTPDEENGKVFTLTDLDLGPSYKFIAYYEPLVVVYHLEDPTEENLNVQVETREEGERLGTSPTPLYDEAQLGTGGTIYSFAGWTTEQPNAEGHQYYLMDSYGQKIPFVSPSDIVTHSLELFPAYAPVNITVSSTIDVEINLDDTISESEVRYIARDSGTGNITVNALEKVEVNGTAYVFTGWKVKDSSDGDGRDFSQDNIAVVDEVFDGAEYIAQYKKGFTVNYHYWKADGTDEILYSVGVTEGDGRTFLQSSTITNPDGSQEEISVPYDTEAFIRILSTLSSDQYFDQWQWVRADGTGDNAGMTVEDWDEFADQAITGNMELYPVIWQVQTFDSEDSLLENNEAVYTQAALSNDESGEQKVSVYFDGVYSQPSLRVNVSKKSYSDTGTDGKNGVFVGRPGIWVNVYNEYELVEVPSADGTGTETEMTGTLMDGKKTDEDGNAVFTFDGLLALEKAVSDGVDEDEPFLFTVKEVTEQGDGEELQVVVRAGETVTVKLPFGEYIVMEDGTWAWRYTPGYVADTKDTSSDPSGEEEGSESEDESARGRISTRSGGADAGGWGEPETAAVYINSYNSAVTCTNEVKSSKWFDSAVDSENVFKYSLTGSE